MQIVIDGILTHYEVIGNKPKILLILHGWMRSLDEWLPTAKRLSSEYTVILLDLPGFGQTHRPEETFTIYDYANFVTRFLSKINVNRISLIGHSFGGRIGIILGAKTPILEKLVLVDSAAVETKSMLTKLKVASNQTAILPIKILFPNKVEKLKARFGSNDYQSAGNLRDIFINIVNADLTHLLKMIRVKTLVIWGEKDQIRLINEGIFIKRIIPNADFRVVWGSGHDPHLENPKEFTEIVKDYLVFG